MSAKRRVAPTCIVVITAAIAACLAPALSSTEQPAVVSSGSQVNFPPTVVGSASAPIQIRISPQSGSADSMDTITSVVETCADFSVTGPVPAEVSRKCGVIGSDQPQIPTAVGGEESDAVECPKVTTVADYDVVFQPVSAGAKSCALTFNGTFGQFNVQLSGSAAPPPFAMRVSPANINFGDVRVNIASPRVMVTISNNGSMALQIGGVTIAGPAFELIGSGSGSGPGQTGPHTLDAGSIETFEVRCQPPNISQHLGTLTVTAMNVPTVNIPLQCQGTNSQLVANPQLVDLTTRQNEEVTQVITITNVGNLPANIMSYSVGGHPELMLVSGGLIGLLGSGASTQATVRYTATTERPGGELGSLTVTEGSNASKISISGEAKATEIGIVPAVIDFGAVCSNRMKELPVSVLANLAGHVTVGGTIAPAAPFTFVPQVMLPATAEANQKQPVPFVARVQPTREGALTSTVVVLTDVPGTPRKEIQLTVEGLADGVSATPARVDFGGVNPGGIPPGKPVQLTNCDAADLVVTGARIEGPNASDFGIASPADPRMTVRPTEHGEFLIVLSPGVPGPKQATLVIEHAAGTTSVDLTGTTIGPTDDGDRRETYYQCSAGGGAAPWPLGLAVLAMLRRRRRRRAQ